MNAPYVHTVYMNTEKHGVVLADGSDPEAWQRELEMEMDR